MRYKFLPSFVKRRGRITQSQEDNLNILPNYLINSYEDIRSEKANFSSANLTRVNFKGSSLIETNFSNSNLFEADFTGANILNSNFEGANLNNSIWIDGKKCNLGSIGKCVK